MPRRQIATVGLVVVSAVVFGVMMAVVHGSQGGLRGSIGSLSAPWLIVGFGSGAALRDARIWRGAVSGLLATAVALCAFYVTNIWVLGISGHGALGDLWFALSTGAYYIRLGLLSGPVMGALGALWRKRRSLGAGLVATGLLVFEPLAWLAYYQGALPRDFVPIAVAETSVGLALSFALVLRRRPSALQ